jgi:carboxyl-terminal processing protease
MLKFMKNKILIPTVILAALAAFYAFRYANPKPIPKASEEKRIVVMEAVMRGIEAGHYSPKALDDTFSDRVYKRMVNAFDYDKLYFTSQDINKLKAYEFQIDDEIKAGSIEFFDTLDAMFLRRMNSAEQFYPELLSKPFSFNGEEEIQLNAAKEEYASDETGLKDRWKEFLKYRVLGKYVDLKNDQDKKKENKDSVNVKMKTDAELEAQAREDVSKYYQRYFKSMHKRKDDDRYTFYVNSITETEDPHTSYFPPAEKSDFDATMSGSFFGIGAQLKQNIETDEIEITDVITGSASWKEGELKAGDKILKVAQGDKTPVDISGYDLPDVVKLIRGDKGTEVRLTVKKADGSVRVIAIKRDIVNVESTFAKSAIIKSKEGQIGYIYLPEFYADFNHTSGRSCAKDVAAEVKKLQDAGVKGIILDLRDNGGGSLNDVVEMAGVFIGRGPVVQVKNNHSSPNVLNAQPVQDTPAYSGPLAVMVNENSASASEILAAALQDYKRAVIVGATTYGKGTVQKMFDLDQMLDPMTRLRLVSDSSSSSSIGDIKLTVEKFYRVNGGSTQMKGVTPDIPLPDAYEAYDDEDLGERHNKAALPWDEIPAASYKTLDATGNMELLAKMSASRVKSNETFNLIQENSDILKEKKDDNRVSLNETKYRKEQEELNATSKKIEELQKKATTLDMLNIQSDLKKIEGDSSAVAKNTEWIKNRSKDIYISETTNIIDDMLKSEMKVTLKGEMKH